MQATDARERRLCAPPSDELATCPHRSAASQNAHFLNDNAEYQAICRHAVHYVNPHDLRTSGASLHDFGATIFLVIGPA